LPKKHKKKLNQTKEVVLRKSPKRFLRNIVVKEGVFCATIARQVIAMIAKVKVAHARSAINE
jgi:hypothetical protein